jgi:hypothetical protein
MLTWWQASKQAGLKSHYRHCLHSKYYMSFGTDPKKNFFFAVRILLYILVQLLRLRMQR